MMTDNRNSDQVQAVNDCAHAIEDLRKMAVSPEARRFSAYSDVCVAAAKGLQQAVKFLLPNRAELLDPSSFSQTYFDLLKLPYPCIAIEAPWSGFEEETGAIKTSKRIALCWEPGAIDWPGSSFEMARGRDKRDGVFVLPISYVDQNWEWQSGVGGVFVPYGESIMERPLDDEVSQLAFDRMHQEGRIKKWSKAFRAQAAPVHEMLLHHLAMQKGSIEQALADIIRDSHDEVWMLLQTCAVLNCANVETGTIPAPAKLNRSRLQSGKVPFFDYKVLTISSDKTAGNGARDGAMGGHSSPRMHLRRGHIRRLENKRMVWVRPTTVGYGGEFKKDYRLKPGATPPQA